MSDTGLPVILLVGPTAVGKSGLALRLAPRLNAEIVSADSVQVYRGLDIGSAKPDAAARAAVPHHCLDLVGPEVNYTVADYARDAQAAIAAIRARGKRVLVVGGSGLYVRALTDGLCPAPPGDAAVRKQITDDAYNDPLKLYRRLQQVDPVAAAVADPRNVRRVVRALEVFVISGKPLSAWWQETPKPNYPVVQIGLDLPRAELYRRIDERVAQMWTGGLLDECRRLLAAGCDPGLKSLGTLGYRHALLARSESVV